MRAKKLLFLTLALSLLTACGAAPQAANRSLMGMDQEEWRSLSNSASLESLTELDTNRDRQLTLDESGLDTAAFRSIDVDGNGKITTVELLREAMRQAEAFQKADAQAEPEAPKVQPPTVTPLSLEARANQAELFIDADQIYPAMLESMRSAQDSIQIDYFLLGGDIGKQIAEILAERQRNGVTIQVMLDGKAGIAGPTQNQVKEVMSRLKLGSIPFKSFPIKFMPQNRGMLANRFQIDHNKLVVVDRRVAWVGSMNLFDFATMNHDLMARIEGPVAAELSRMMAEEWGVPLPAPKDPVRILPIVPELTSSMIRLHQTGIQQRNTKDILLANIAAARRTIDVAMFEWSDLDIVKALGDAKRRGVQVRVLLDRHASDEKYMPWLRFTELYGIPNLYAAKHLMKEGLELKWYDAQLDMQELHMKLSIFDGEKAVFGSTNYTFQAFNNFRETGVEVTGGPILTQLTGMFERDWASYGTRAKSLNAKERITASFVAYMEKKRIGWW
ncbi:putative cardiolipin synthase YwiE [compost metagenome]